MMMARHRAGARKQALRREFEATIIAGFDVQLFDGVKDVFNLGFVLLEIVDGHSIPRAAIPVAFEI